MTRGPVDPKKLFARIASELPEELLEHLYVAGSLAAARHHADALGDRGVKTKDADLVVFPTGDAGSAAAIAKLLLSRGWRPTEKCYPSEAAEPADELRAIRLYPPGHNDYFIEFLNVPREDATEAKSWLQVELDDGWYGMPSFEFLGLTLMERERADGLQYASPCMMALANLLSHRTVGTARMTESIDGRSILRSAKDLGRSVALARLAGDDEAEQWPRRWMFALKDRFPKRHSELASRVGDGLRALLADDDAFEEAWFTSNYSILAGLGVTVPQLRASANRLLKEVVEPTENAGREMLE